MRQFLYDGDTFDHLGQRFRVHFPTDDSADPPWDNGDDGRGIVSEWTTRPPKPGERVLCRDGYHVRYFDTDATFQKALTEEWDAEPYGGPARERARRAMEAEWETFRRYARGDWGYVGVVVTREPVIAVPATASVWGCESSDPGSLTSTAYEIAAEVPDDDLTHAQLIAAAPDLLAALTDLVARADTTELADGSSLDTAHASAILARIRGTE
jgi:hypothetical protein